MDLPRFMKIAKPPSDKTVDLLDAAVQKMFTLQEDRRRPSLGNFYHLKSPLLGPNILITRRDDKLSVIAFDGSSPVEQNIAKMLNGSVVLENYGNPQDYYFLQPK